MDGYPEKEVKKDDSEVKNSSTHQSDSNEAEKGAQEPENEDSKDAVGPASLFAAGNLLARRKRGTKLNTGLDIVAQRLSQIVASTKDPNRPPPDLALLSQIC